MTTPDWQADYKAAQALGHHEDCDGYRLAHRVTFETEHACWRAVCIECGPLHDGWARTETGLRGYHAHSRLVPCDGRCRDWR